MSDAPLAALPAASVALLAEAAAWRVLSLLFTRPRPGWREELERLGLQLDRAELGSLATAVSAAAREGEFLALLGPGGPVSPREVAAQPRRDPGHLLGEIEACYEAFAYVPQAEDPPDHVAVEAGFIGYLRLKEAFALAAKEAEAAVICREAAADFLAEHLAPLAAALRTNLPADGPAPYLAVAAALLADLAGPPRSAPQILPILEPDPSEDDACAAVPTPSFRA